MWKQFDENEDDHDANDDDDDDDDNCSYIHNAVISVYVQT